MSGSSVLCEQPVIAESQATIRPGVLPGRGTKVASPIQVLLVEDDPETAEMVQTTLTDDPDDPYHVEWAANLVEALIRLSQPGINVVLLDLGLPESSGDKSYRVIEAATGNRAGPAAPTRKLPVVIFTSDDRTTSIETTLGLGAAGYLLKHESSPALLKQALRSAVLRRGST